MFKEFCFDGLQNKLQPYEYTRVIFESTVRATAKIKFSEWA
jgi:hypothetical protein